MWTFTKIRKAGARPLGRALYIRYMVVVLILLALVGLIELWLLDSTMTIAGQNSLTFALRDALGEPPGCASLTPNVFRARVPELLNAWAVRGISVRLYDAELQPLGERHSSYNPLHLVRITPAIASLARQTQSVQFSGQARIYLTTIKGQILLFAAVGPVDHVSGYVELGYRASLLYPFVVNLGLRFFALSVIVLVISAVLLFPLVEATLRPLHRLLKSALAIREGAFQRRLPEIGTAETVRLAVVMNEVLDKLAQAIEKEQDVTKRMKRFVSSASHELRTPLTAIRGFTDVLLRRVEADWEERLMLRDGLQEGDLSLSTVQKLLVNNQGATELRQALETMQSEARRLEALLQNLLHLARLDEGLAPKLEAVDLAILVAELQPQLDVLIGKREIIYDLHPTPTRCDRAMVRQILYNLVANAIQYTSEDSGLVLIRVMPTEAGERARLVVKDNGVGIEASQVQYIFDRFYRASEAREGNLGGTGLGLSIVKEIVRAHHGEIRVESEVGAGTSFIVEL